MPGKTKLVIQALKSVEKRQIALDNEFELERLKLEKKYAERQRPLYERRTALITGKVPPTDQEMDEGAVILKEELKDYDKDYNSPAKSALGKAEQIPDFWLTVLQRSEDVAFMISERDEVPLKSLLDVRCSYLAPDGPDPSFRISFSFAPNVFFRNTLLHKDYKYKAGPTAGDEWVFERANASTINWHAGKDLTKKTKNGDDEGELSFFNFFYPPDLPSPEDLKAGKLDVEYLEKLEAIMEGDLEVGEALKDDVIPDAVDLFIYPPDDSEDDEDDEDDEDEDDDEDDDDEDEDSD